MRWVLHRYCLRLLLVFFSFCFLDSSVCACSCSSPASSLLLSTSWVWPVSSAPGLSSPPLVSVAPCLHAVTLPGAPMFFSCLCSSSFLLCSSWLRCGSLWLCFSAVWDFCNSLFTCSDTPWRSSVFSGLCSSSFCAAPLGSAAVLFGFASSSAGSSFGFVGSAPQPGSAPAYTPLSGTSAAPSVFLSHCLVSVLMSLCSWFVAPVAPGVAAPVPEAFIPHLCLPPLPLVSALYIYRYLVAILTLAAGSSQAPLPPCSLSWSFPAPSDPIRHVSLS